MLFLQMLDSLLASNSTPGLLAEFALNTQLGSLKVAALSIQSLRAVGGKASVSAGGLGGSVVVEISAENLMELVPMCTEQLDSGCDVVVLTMMSLGFSTLQLISKALENIQFQKTSKKALLSGACRVFIRFFFFSALRGTIF